MFLGVLCLMPVFVMQSFLVLQSLLWKREMSRGMKFPTIWYVRTAKAQTSLLVVRITLTVRLLAEHCFEFHSLKGCCTALSASTLVKISDCWKSHVPAQMIGPHREETCLLGICEQHRRRPACAYVQSDQRLCYSLFGKYHV